MASQLTPTEANRRFYEDVAATYDQKELCIALPAQRERLVRMLDLALARLSERPRVLDACGGSGNASELLMERGLETLVVDVSPEMTELWRRKAAARGHQAQIELAPIEEFLARDDRVWDLIVFSSALHHLDRYEEVAAAAVGRLAKGGLLVTVYDPTLTGRLGKLLRRVDWILHGLLHLPHRTLGVFAARVRRALQPRDVPHIGRAAELHALTGVDDVALVERLRASGAEVVEHRREYDARYAVIRGAFRLARRPSTFSLLARRPAG